MRKVGTALLPEQSACFSRFPVPNVLHTNRDVGRAALSIPRDACISLALSAAPSGAGFVVRRAHTSLTPGRSLRPSGLSSVPFGSISYSPLGLCLWGGVHAALSTHLRFEQITRAPYWHGLPPCGRVKRVNLMSSYRKPS